LGFGLVFPCIVGSKVPFAIMQPPFAEFDPMLNGGKSNVRVVINRMDAIDTGLDVVTEKDDISNLHKKDGGSLVLIEEGEKWDQLIKQATSFSCSIGPKVPEIIGPVLMKNLPEVPEHLQPILYGCENDHGAVKRLGKMLSGRARVVPCMVDRICSEREIQEDKIVVTTEPWSGTIIPLTPMDELYTPEEEGSRAPVPLGGESVFLPRTRAVAEYRYHRKLFFVNHMHTVLALMTLTRFRQEKHLKVEALLDAPGSCIGVPLTNPNNMPITQKLELKAWMTAQILMLIRDNDIKIMLEAHTVFSVEDLCQSLVEIATQRSGRFATVYDTCDRVLGAGVALRFSQRLLPAYDAVAEMLEDYETWAEDDPKNRVLYYSGLSLYDVYWSLKRMVSEGQEIADADLIKRGEIAEQRGEPTLDDFMEQLDWLVCGLLRLEGSGPMAQ